MEIFTIISHQGTQCESSLPNPIDWMAVTSVCFECVLPPPPSGPLTLGLSTYSQMLVLVWTSYEVASI